MTNSKLREALTDAELLKLVEGLLYEDCSAALRGICPPPVSREKVMRIAQALKDRLQPTSDEGTPDKLYAERDAMRQGKHYTKHLMAMTAEELHNKSDIAAELAHRDIQIEQLERTLHAKRAIYVCKTHGEWDAYRASGCPDCMVDARRQFHAKERELELARVGLMETSLKLQSVSAAPQEITASDREMIDAIIDGHYERWGSAVKGDLHGMLFLGGKQAQHRAAAPKEIIDRLQFIADNASTVIPEEIEKVCDAVLKLLRAAPQDGETKP